jgi:uncharacterized protein YbjQ (UPF0145 family)
MSIAPGGLVPIASAPPGPLRTSVAFPLAISAPVADERVESAKPNGCSPDLAGLLAPLAVVEPHVQDQVCVHRSRAREHLVLGVVLLAHLPLHLDASKDLVRPTLQQVVTAHSHPRQVRRLLAGLAVMKLDADHGLGADLGRLSFEDLERAIDAVYRFVDIHEAQHLARTIEVVREQDAALLTLRERAALIGADAVLGIEFHHEGDGPGANKDIETHLSGLAVRFRPVLQDPPYEVLGQSTAPPKTRAPRATARRPEGTVQVERPAPQPAGPTH